MKINEPVQLRDKFALEIMKVLITATQPIPRDRFPQVADTVYKLADAMMHARKEK